MNESLINSLSNEIEELSSKLNMSTIDAIVHYCEINKVEIDAIVPLLSKKIKGKVHREAVQLRMVKDESKSQKLPL